MKDKVTDKQKEALKLAIAELKPQQTIVMPAVSVVEAKKAWTAYQEMKQAVMTPDDIQLIQGRQFLKKSYWRKIATFFNLSVDVVNEWKEGDEKDGNVTYHFVCKAIAPNGRFAVGAGSCDLVEKGRKNTIHNTRSTAETRAWNRAVSNLVGGGEVSAEEMTINKSDENVSKSYTRKIVKKNGGKCSVDHSALPVLTVKKEGRNQGKQFVTCKECGFFEWR